MQPHYHLVIRACCRKISNGLCLIAKTAGVIAGFFICLNYWKVICETVYAITPG